MWPPTLHRGPKSGARENHPLVILSKQRGGNVVSHNTLGCR